MKGLLPGLVGSAHTLWLLSPVFAQPASLVFQDCFSDSNATQKLQISTVYAQVLDGGRLDLTVLGTAPVQIVRASNTTDNPVATTLFTTTEQLSFTVFNNQSYFCSTLRPQSPLPASNASDYCPLDPGPFALSSTIFLPGAYELATLNTRLRALDPYTTELFCIDVATTPLKPGPIDSVYGNAAVIFWASVALAISYWLVVGLARIVSAWGRGLGRSSPGIWHRVESTGFIFASALSGERLATSPALLRFCTPSLRDIIFHTQWCAALGMVAVQWPQFVYPLLSQTGWSMLSFNVTLTQKDPLGSAHWNPLYVPTYSPPSNFADQMSDSSSPIYIDSNVPNTLFMLPPNVTTGIPAFAAAVGLHPDDLFGVTQTLFLGICAAAVALSGIVWGIDQIASLIRRITGSSGAQPTIGTRSPHFGSANKDDEENGARSPTIADEARSLNSNFMLRGSRTAAPSMWRLRPEFSSFHGSVLQGNLIRVLVLFHFPITIFSCYQMTTGRIHTTISSVILAALSFAVFSVLVPVILLFRLYATNTSKLYDETWTLLALGPLYNHYRHGSQLFACLLFASNIAFGITIGCGQQNGTVQAIIILVIEVVSALGTSFWLPWGQGASMGLISFLFCVARIVIAVLMVILAPIVSIADGAGQWVAYAILVILALVYLAFLLMLVVKLIEALVRIFGGVGFHQSRHVVDSGLFGASGLAGCCGSRKKQRSSRRPHRATDVPRVPSSQISLNRPPNQTLQLGANATPTDSTPPSVLRPEHAYQPYREESDDEEGFIMGAWHSLPRGAKYTAVDDQPPLEVPKKSGFARVGGGRSHFETPYAIQTGSTATFPSVAGQSTTNTGPRRVSSPTPTPNMSTAARQTLPPGAMAPHIRTKSQTAVIEDPAVLAMIAASKNKPPAFRRVSDDDMSLEMSQPKKKPWYQKLRNRRHSDGEMSVETINEYVPTEPAPAPTPGSSFVVVRKGQQPAPSSLARPVSAAGEPSAPKKSFVVLRE